MTKQTILEVYEAQLANHGRLSKRAFDIAFKHCNESRKYKKKIRALKKELKNEKANRSV